MYPLQAYFSREISVPSATQGVINALSRGAEIYVDCGKCEGTGRVKNLKKRKRRFSDICSDCGGQGRFLRRYDHAMRFWRESTTGQLRRCSVCLGKRTKGDDVCEACEGRLYEQALDACPKGPAQHPALASAWGELPGAEEPYYDAAIDCGWELGRLPDWVQEIVTAWYRPDAVAYRARLGKGAGHALAAPLLPFTRLGQLAYHLEKQGDTEAVNEIIDAAYAEAAQLKRAAFVHLTRSKRWV